MGKGGIQGGDLFFKTTMELDQTKEESLTLKTFA